MNQMSPTRERWLPVVVVLLAAMLLGATIVTVWPPA